MIVATAENIPGKNLEVIGMVSGNIAFSRHVGRDLMAGLKNIAGGEIKSYTEMVADAQVTARERMVEEAARLGGDAVTCTRIVLDTVAEGTIEVICYGTAVKFV